MESAFVWSSMQSVGFHFVAKRKNNIEATTPKVV